MIDAAADELSLSRLPASATAAAAAPTLPYLGSPAAPAPGLTDAAARSVFSTATPCSESEEFVAMPDGSFCRAALLAGEPLTSVEYDWIGYTLQRQPCDDVRQAIYEWVTREFEHLGLHRDKDNANTERCDGCISNLIDAIPRSQPLALRPKSRWAERSEIGLGKDRCGSFWLSIAGLF